MALAGLRDALRTRLATVTGVGVVTDFEPLATRAEDFRSYFVDPDLGIVQGWTITRESTQERAFDTERNWQTHVFVVRGYRALGDHGETEKAFQDLVERVRVTLRREQRDQLGGLAEFVGPPQVRIVEARKFGEFTVHYAEIALACQEQVAIVAS